MQEPQDIVETALYGAAWDEPLPAVMYQDPFTDEGVDKDIADGQEKIKESFKIDDQGKANWVIRRVGEAQKRHHGAIVSARAEEARIKKWLERVLKKESREIEFFDSLLRDYAHDELAKSDGKERSIALSEGTLKFIKRQPRLHYDKDELLEELDREGLDKLIRRKHTVEPNLVEIKQAIKGGFVLKSITVEEQEDGFTVSVNE